MPPCTAFQREIPNRAPLLLTNLHVHTYIYNITYIYIYIYTHHIYIYTLYIHYIYIYTHTHTLLDTPVEDACRKAQRSRFGAKGKAPRAQKAAPCAGWWQRRRPKAPGAKQSLRLVTWLRYPPIAYTGRPAPKLGCSGSRRNLCLRRFQGSGHVLAARNVDFPSCKALAGSHSSRTCSNARSQTTSRKDQSCVAKRDGAFALRILQERECIRGSQFTRGR